MFAAIGLAVLVLLPMGSWSAPRLRDAAGGEAYFPTVVGTKWVFEAEDGRYEEEIREAKADGKAVLVTVVRTKEDKEVWHFSVRVSADGVDQVASAGAVYDRPMPLLPARATAGAEWECPYIVGGVALHVRTKFVGVESVEVPAGKYRAHRLDSVQTIVGLECETRSTVWFAPGFGVVKRASNGAAATLKSYVPGK